jgi:uracil-DNA glycosylase family 4
VRNFVPGVGPKDARIVLVGEAPGPVEDKTLEPFTGPSGNLQNRWWNETIIERAEVRIENLYPYLPPAGQIERVNVEELAYWIQDLRERIAALEDPYVIVPTGNYATYALTGKGKVKAALRKELGEDIETTEAERKAGITKLRGSVYAYSDLGGRILKVIPTIHPAWFLYKGGFNMKKQRRALADWRRIKRESARREISRKSRTHIIDPTEGEIRTFVEYVEANPSLTLSVDIETWGKRLSCVGFAPSEDYSFTIPLADKAQTERNLPYVRSICESVAAKVTQGGHYDAYWLYREGIVLNNWQWDTLAMHHCLHPTDEHSLHYIASIYCPDYAYWKDEAKDAEEIIKYVRDLDALWTYNGMDCCYTRELVNYLYAELVERDLLDFYGNHYRDLFAPMLDVMCHGVAVDTNEQKTWRKMLLKQCADARKKLEAIAREDVYATKDFSPKKLKKLFLGLGCPRQYKQRKTTTGRKKTETLDEAALRKIATRVRRAKTQTPESFEESKEAARLVLSHRRKTKLAHFLKGAWDRDGRIRCQYKFQTEAGRFASSKNPMGTGYNLQNVDREIRNTFVPDQGCVFIKIDMSQIEDRIVKMWTQSPRLVELANLHPTVYDCHTHSASLIFTKSEKDVTYKERYLGKRTVHAAERGMAGKRLSEELLKDFDLIISPRVCQRYIDTFMKEFWEIPEVYFRDIRERCMRDKMLKNNWGREWHCKYDRFDQDLYRRAYSFNPQSDAADWLNQWGFKPLAKLLNTLRSRINLQVHDELIVSCPPEEAFGVAAFTVAMLEQPRYYFGNKLVVPACVTVARHWKDDKYEFKKLPSRSRFEEAVDVVYQETKGKG